MLRQQRTDHIRCDIHAATSLGRVVEYFLFWLVVPTAFALLLSGISANIVSRFPLAGWPRLCVLTLSIAFWLMPTMNGDAPDVVGGWTPIPVGGVVLLVTMSQLSLQQIIQFLGNAFTHLNLLGALGVTLLVALILRAFFSNWALRVDNSE